MPLYAGVCETNITPPPGVWMSGYAFRPSGSIGVHDELAARVLVFANGQAMAALVSMDLIGLDFDLVERVRTGIEAQTGIPSNAVLLNASHTHGGPTTRTYNGMGPRDEAYVDVLVRKLIGAAKQAAGSLQPASVAFGSAPVQIGVNRRQSDGHGTRIGANLGGPVDTRVRALVVRDSRGRPFAAAFSHACHGTTLGGDNLLTTADFCGVACETVRAETGGAIVPLFLQGCCGNINPHPRGSFEHARQHGRALGLATLEAIEQAEADRIADPAGIDSEEMQVDLPLIPPPSADACRELLACARADLEKEKAGGSVGRIQHAEGMVRYAEMALGLCDADPGSLRTPFVLHRVSVGGIQALGMPGEVFVQYALDLERQSQSPVLTLGYTNGVQNYVPTAADYARGGYEIDSAHVYYHSLMFASDCERLIRAAAYEMLGIERPNWSPYSV